MHSFSIPLTLQLLYARSIGYVVKRIFEGYCYKEKAVILYDYMTFLAKCKLIHEALPVGVDVDSYLNDINSTMGFTGDNVITKTDLEPNLAKKQHIKDMMNQGKTKQSNCIFNSSCKYLFSSSLGLGKFLQRNDQTFTEYCKSPEEVDYWYNQPHLEVVLCCYVTENIVQLGLKPKKEFVKPNRNTHVCKYFVNHFQRQNVPVVLSCKILFSR